MYDTLFLWLPAEWINESGYLDRVPTLLSNIKQTYNSTTEQIYFTGGYEGLNLSVSTSGISIKGSICKSYRKDNFKTLTRQDTERAFESLQDKMSLPILNAKVRRIDFSQSYSVSQLPESYYPLLGDCKGYQRLKQPKSLYYQNGSKTLLFYNKIEEGKSKKLTIPSIWADKHILRYELRYTKRISEQFKMDIVKASDLYQESFYMELVDRYIREYQNIYKNNQIIDSMNLTSINTPKDFIYQMALIKIKELGMEATIESVEQLKAKDQFKHKEHYSRLKADIKKLCKNDKTTLQSPLITELDKKISQVKCYCR